MSYFRLTTFTRFSKQLLFNILLLMSLGYFIFHTIYGDLGVFAYFRLNQQLTKTQSILEDLMAKNIELEHHVKLLKSGDKDFLDEMARNILGIASPKELIFSTTQASVISNEQNP